MKTAGLFLHTEKLNGQAIYIPPSAHTFEGFRAWATSDDFPERGRFAFIAGQLYVDVTMEELETHNKIKTETTSVLHLLNKELDKGELYSDRARVTNVAAGVSNEPDATFVLWESFESGQAHLVPSARDDEAFVEIEGTPDWLMEIVSKYSVEKDTEVLREAYHRAKVPEYWLIDARGEEIDFQILLYRRSGYVAAPSRGGWKRSQVFGRSFRLVRERGRLGHWKYTLQVKP